MLRAFFRDSAIYGTARMLTGGIALLSLPIYTRALKPADYGAVDLLTTIATIAYVTVALEIGQGYGRYALATEGREARERYASTAFWFTLAAYSLFVAIIIPLTPALSAWLLGDDAYAGAFRVAALVIWTTGLFNLLQTILRYERRAVAFGALSVMFSAMSVGVTIALLLVWRVGLVGVFIGQFVAGVIVIASGLWIARHAIRPVFDRARWREMILFSAPLVPSGLGVLLTTYVDRYAIVRLLPLDELGFYGVAFRIASVAGVALAGLVSAVAPLIYQHHHEPGTPAQIARMFQWFLALALPLVLFLGLFSPELVRVAAPQEYLNAAPIVLPLAAAIVAASCYNFAPGLWIANRTGWIAIIGLSSGALNLALNFLLIPRFGLVSAGLSAVLSAAAASIAHFASSQRCYPVPFRWARVGAALLLVVVAAGWFTARSVAAIDLSASLFARAATWAVVSGAVAALLIGMDDVQLATHRLRRALS